MIRRFGGGARALAGTAALSLALGCARQGAPAGGIQDRVPPVVVSVEPEPFSEVAPGTDRLRVRYNERISERVGSGNLETAVLISPEIPDLQVDHKRDGLDIRVPGGLRPGVTYTVRILPVVQDMFGNPMAGPFEWAVSTGGEFTENAVVGQIWDRGTGEFLQDMRVVLVPDPAEGADTLRYAVTSGNEGLYALRILPAGPFRIEAYQDRNRNRVLDPGEPRGSARDSLGTADTLFLSLPVLTPDSTAAVLAQGEVLDSTVVRLAFDDLVDPTIPLDGVSVTLMRDTATAGEGEPAAQEPVAAEAEVRLPGIARTFHEWAWSQYRDSLVAVADSVLRTRVEAARAAGDTARADSLARGGPGTIPGGPAPRVAGAAGAGAPTLPDGSPVPEPSIVILLDGPLPAGIPVLFQVDGIVNVHGLPGGGGSRAVTWTPEPPDSVAADTTGLRTGEPLPPDTGRVLLSGRLTTPARR